MEKKSNWLCPLLAGFYLHDKISYDKYTVWNVHQQFESTDGRKTHSNDFIEFYVKDNHRAPLIHFIHVFFLLQVFYFKTNTVINIKRILTK